MERRNRGIKLSIAWITALALSGCLLENPNVEDSEDAGDAAVTDSASGGITGSDTKIDVNTDINLDTDTNPNTDININTNAETDGDTESDSDTTSTNDSETNAEININTDTHQDANSDTNSNFDTDSDTDIDTISSISSDNDIYSETESDTNTNGDPNNKTDSDTGSSGQDSGSDRDTDTDSDEDTDPHSDTDSGGSTDTGTNAEIDSETDSTVCGPDETRPCQETYGNCAEGIETCYEDGSGWGECSIQPKAADGCEPGDDANCNGIQNEGCACTNDETQVCGIDIGICKFGTQSCVDGHWSSDCVGEVTKEERDCSSTEDNDCNGTIDNEETTYCKCKLSDPSRSCDPYSTEGRGICSLGTETCELKNNGTNSDWVCTGADEPETEVCDSYKLDEDCDGEVNEGCLGEQCLVDNDCLNGMLCVSGGGKKYGISGDACMPSHCDNNTQDADETSIDCGGECGCLARLEWINDNTKIAGISDDGAIMVGYTGGSSGHPVYWDSSLVRHDLEGYRAYGGNGDGSVIVGSADGRPARWVSFGVDPFQLNDSVFLSGSARSVSVDGSTIVGGANDGDLSAAYFWRGGTVTWEYGFVEFTAVSADGNVALGSKRNANNSSGPVALWTSSGVTDFALPSDWEASYVGAMSRDATHVTGLANSQSTSGTRAFLWREGEAVLLYDGLNGTPHPTAVANTGRIVGQTGSGGMPANYWGPDTDLEARLLTDLMADQGYELAPDVELWGPEAITPDGLVIVGPGLGACRKKDFNEG